MNQKNLLNVIGNTPIIKLNKIVPVDAAEVWVKLEGLNPTGSYKDRLAMSILQNALERGDVQTGQRVVEYTGGSTGTSLAFVSAILGLEFTAVFSNAFAKAKQQSMEAFGAEVVVINSPGGKITPELIQKMKNKAYELAEQPNTFYADQFNSPDIKNGYESLGVEIASQLENKADVLCAAVGTGGALMGTYSGMVSSGMDPKLIALEPLQSPLLTTGEGGAHRVEGIGLGFEPPFLDKEKVDEMRAIDEEDAFEMCRLLAKEEGILGGGSTGLNVCAAIEIAKEIGPGKRVVTLNCDNGLKYLGGYIYS
ncbi:MAG TPA: cysteine synthase family protein [Halobacteriales archaeon]|uniref:PLP-dependent cysteine synthase family protein n=1 Tax=Candidatus Hikarchaeum yamanae TaxID=2675326 RepID=UPI001821AE29|nr:cysteine synthase family protein [Halobacteriales archaeon]|tara:strand:+ start:10938 stop:11864 length:927 start_codon:yes stop_codon:yes gene_type:complete